MQQASVADRVKEFAQSVLARRVRLSPASFPLTARAILRGCQALGLHFALRGPRDVVLTAIWEAHTGLLYCYDSRGQRFHVAATGLIDPAFDKRADH